MDDHHNEDGTFVMLSWCWKMLDATLMTTAKGEEEEDLTRMMIIIVGDEPGHKHQLEEEEEEEQDARLIVTKGGRQIIQKTRNKKESYVWLVAALYVVHIEWRTPRCKVVIYFHHNGMRYTRFQVFFQGQNPTHVEVHCSP